MKERGIKQIDILNLAAPYCKKYGVKLNKNDLSQYVNGKVEPGQHKLFILSLALDVNEAWLMGFDEVSMSREAQGNAQEPKPLNVIEQRLINNFRELNHLGQSKLLDYSEDLITSGNYLKETPKEKHA